MELEVINFYENLVGSASDKLLGVDIVAMRGGKQLNGEQCRALVNGVSKEEIVEALYSLGNNKAPGLDGYTAQFFKASWKVVGDDLIKAVKFFFEKSRMLKEANCTLVALLPKVSNADSMGQMRPISCCSTFYKIISKVLTIRLRRVIADLVGENQSAFVLGRIIQDNVILAQELVRGYARKSISPRCMIQIDLKKAYDSVEWSALEKILREFGFPAVFVKWIMECVTSVSYRYSVNGQVTQLVHAKRGLRQGDPISPFLFVLVMEYLNRILGGLNEDPNFNFHPKCGKLLITNLCFADDLLLFTRGDLESVKLMMKKFDEFSGVTGLRVNPEKCRIFFGGVPGSEQEEILMHTGFARGKLPVKYLGVPLDSRKLSVHNCLPLIEKIVCRIKHWTSNLLSYAGRIQLIRSVLNSIVFYWLQVFPIPGKVLKHVEGVCRSFLWSGREIITRKAPVAWEKLCRPKSAGGLNLVDLSVWKKVMSMKLLWNLCGKKDKLWICWLHEFYMKQNTVMEYQVKGSESWIVKALLKSRSLIEAVPNWRMLSYDQKFPARKIYRDLMGRSESVWWRKLFFDNFARPTSKFIMWSACLNRLYTRDRLKKFGICNEEKCVLCNSTESVQHLFLECELPGRIWAGVLDWLRIKHVPAKLDDEIRWVTGSFRSKSCLGKLLKCAITETVYAVWQMRNKKLFQEVEPNEEAWKGICNLVAIRCAKRRDLNEYMMKLDGRM